MISHHLNFRVELTFSLGRQEPESKNTGAGVSVLIWTQSSQRSRNYFQKSPREREAVEVALTKSKFILNIPYLANSLREDGWEGKENRMERRVISGSVPSLLAFVTQSLHPPFPSKETLGLLIPTFLPHQNIFTYHPPQCHFPASK